MNNITGMAVAIPAAGAAPGTGVIDLIRKIKDSNAEVRTKAWQGAGELGAAGVEPMAGLMTDENLEVARAAKRALWKIVRHTGRPGADKQKQAVADSLAGLLGGEVPVAIRREVLWMLSEIGDKKAIEPIAKLLGYKGGRSNGSGANSGQGFGCGPNGRF